MSDTPTPRTDESKFTTDCGREVVFATLCESIETALAAMTAERDEKENERDKARMNAVKAWIEARTSHDEYEKERRKRIAAEVERDELKQFLARANPPPERACECLHMLEAAGMGKPEAAHGNTLTGMMMEICERLAAVTQERDEAKEYVREFDLLKARIVNFELRLATLTQERDSLREKLGVAEKALQKIANGAVIVDGLRADFAQHGRTLAKAALATIRADGEGKDDSTCKCPNCDKPVPRDKSHRIFYANGFQSEWNCDGRFPGHYPSPTNQQG